MSRTKLFISYSRKDAQWRDRLVTQLAVLETEGLLQAWVDTSINPGETWKAELERALTESRVAVLLVSADFLASSFIIKEELPRMFAHAELGLKILPLIVRPCSWKLNARLARLQARPTDGVALSTQSEAQIETALEAFTYEIAELCQSLEQSSAESVAGMDASMSKETERPKTMTVHDVRARLAQTINRGAPMYNAGHHLECARLYYQTARALLDGLTEADFRTAKDFRAWLFEAMPDENDVQEKTADNVAWTLRRVFDRIWTMMES